MMSRSVVVGGARRMSSTHQPLLLLDLHRLPLWCVLRAALRPEGPGPVRLLA